MSTDQRLTTPLTRLVGIEHPVVQTAMGWVSDVALVVATAEAGGLGFLASATMGTEELEAAIVRIKEQTDKPFGVNLRADASDAEARAELLVTHGVKVAGFALAPRRELIARLKDDGVLVVPSVGAVRHAEKVAEWGADMVMVQGGEGGGHTGPFPTSLLIPAIVDAVDIPVIAAGGFYDGRGLAAALSWGAVGVGMGTRFLLTSDCTIPDAVKRIYLEKGLNDTVVTKKLDGVPVRVLDVGLAQRLESEDTAARRGSWLKNLLALKRETGTSWYRLAKDGLAMQRQSEKTLAQLLQAANTPMALQVGLREGDLDRGVLASGQVVGAIDDLPSCGELIDRVVREAVQTIDTLAAARTTA